MCASSMAVFVAAMLLLVAATPVHAEDNGLAQLPFLGSVCLLCVLRPHAHDDPAHLCSLSHTHTPTVPNAHSFSFSFSLPILECGVHVHVHIARECGCAVAVSQWGVSIGPCCRL